jgi:RimJ/RimL family protein N-acetyltransferase
VRPIVIETKRLLIRHLEQEDFADLLRIYNTPENMKYISSGKHNLTIEELREKVETLNKDS